MKYNKLITSIGLTASTFLFVSNIAEAASFKTNFSQNDCPKGNVILESIKLSFTHNLDFDDLKK